MLLRLIAFISFFAVACSKPNSSTFKAYPKASSWMGSSLNIIGGKTLKQLTLPGTHDSGAFWLSDTPLPGADYACHNAFEIISKETEQPMVTVMKPWELAQDQNIYNQLVGGIRYIDLRAGYYNVTNTWVTFHYLIGSPIIEILQNISQFLNDYPTEIVIIEISHFDGYPTAQNIADLQQMTLNILGKFIYPVDLAFNFTINDMINSGKRAIVTMESGYGNVIWPGDSIYNTYADSPVVKTMINFNTQTVAQYMNMTLPYQIFKISWTLTPNDQTVIGTVKPKNPHTLIELADIANPYLPDFVNEMMAKRYQIGNILIIDHFESSAIMNVTYLMNGIS
ncbi:unnamed protein product [Blepharisma stoltei]|uniref:Phosphatidylinositol diacylglycerol-lyase n=1 Tax=Blepharisma stoltei TaxID=1481888 RepID=A0AAU9J574_9CILI|nr:unnamed protein product [Blepharisma stoltei]